jgi:hypothetical protein
MRRERRAIHMPALPIFGWSDTLFPKAGYCIESEQRLVFP